jgi:putative endonuclease
MATHNELGNKGERLAVDFILKKGYTLLEKNWRHKKDELDIIAKHDSCLVIIEVKTRSTNYFGAPEDAVDFKKQQRIIAATNAYVEKNDINLDTRFDVISIITRNSTIEINHIEDAFSTLG